MSGIFHTRHLVADVPPPVYFLGENNIFTLRQTLLIYIIIFSIVSILSRLVKYVYLQLYVCKNVHFA